MLVVNGDTYVQLDHRALLSAHASQGAELTMAICEVPDVARYGALELSGTTVLGFHEKGPPGAGWINAGVYVLGPGLCARFPSQQAFSFEQDLLVPQVRSIRPHAFPTTGLFIDIGIPEDYARAQTLLPLGHQ
jgi:D-glycero-alpha-D-manno-heptose 1-phosphate guanylyltransferase